MYPDKNPFTLAASARIRMFDQVAGFSQVRERFKKNMRYEDVREFLDKDVAEFRKLSRRYWLYK